MLDQDRGDSSEHRSNDQHSAHYGLVPLVIGVTGHRDLRPADVPQLEEKIRSFFNTVSEKYPNTPLTLLSPLAEGADRLVARVALDLDTRLIVPLPMRRELYEQDFTAPSSRAEFERLINRARHVFVLPVARGYSEVEIQNPGEARSYQYEQVGAYIARHSQILLALWDGVYTDLVGSTSAIIKFQMNGVPEPYAPSRSPLDAGEGGEVYHIATPRIKNPPTVESFSVRRLSSNVDADDDHKQPCPPSTIEKVAAGEDKSRMYDRIYERIDKYNQDAFERTTKLASAPELKNSHIVPNEKLESLPTSIKAMSERYAMADALANYFQERMKNTLRGLFLCAFLAAVLLGVYAHMEGIRPLLRSLSLSLFPLITIIGYFVLYVPANRKDYQNKYQDYRALAEGMRVQFFWCLANLKISVADHYLRKQRTELDWICSAVHAWNLPEEDENMPAVQPDRLNGIELVHKYWIMEQLDYFKTSAANNKWKLEQYEPLVKVLLWTGVGLASLLALTLLFTHPMLHGLEGWLEENPDVHGPLIILMSTLFVSAALLHNYAEKRAWAEHHKQYNRMSHLFALAEQRLQKMIQERNYQGAQALIAELGKEALAENGDWVLLHRERPLEPPHAG